MFSVLMVTGIGFCPGTVKQTCSKYFAALTNVDGFGG